MGGKYSCEAVFFGFDWCLKDGYDIIFIYIAFLEKFFDVFFDSVSFKDERSEVEEFREVKSVALDSSLMLRMTGVIRRNTQSLRDSPFKKGQRNTPKILRWCSEWQARCREIPSHYVTDPSKRGEESTKPIKSQAKLKKQKT